MLLQADGIGVRIGDAQIVSDAELSLEAGTLTAIVGPNGAGKSTLMRSVAGLQKLSAGSVAWSGRDLRGLRGRELARLRAFVPQRAAVPDGVSVRQAVRIGRSPHVPPLGRLTHADHAAVDRALERAGAAEFVDRRLTTLSGGELQRVQVAIGLAQETPVLLADEPTSSLDLGATATLVRMLRGLTADGLAVLLVVHDLALAAAVADRIVVMSGGRTVAAGAPAAVLSAERVREVWGVDATLAGDAEGRTGLHVRWL